MERTTARHAFTLLELSIVIGIVALVGGVGLNMANGALKAANRVTTQERLNTIKYALDSYAKTWGYLPCPANRASVPGSGAFGTEARTISMPGCNASGSGVFLTSNVWIGAVPNRTLGLPDSYAGDAWGNKFTYAVSDYMHSSPTSYSTQTGSIGIQYRTSSLAYTQTSAWRMGSFNAVTNSGGYPLLNMPGGVPFGGGGATIHVASSLYAGEFDGYAISATQFLITTYPFVGNDATYIFYLAYNSPGASYAVVSHGPDGQGAWPMYGASVPTNKPCNGSHLDANNCNGGVNFVDIPYNDGAVDAEHFDDYIVWGSSSNFEPSLGPIWYNACPGGVCESWCAKCQVNYPGGGLTVPPTALGASAVLQKKFIQSDAAACKATCIWSGDSASGYYRPL